MVPEHLLKNIANIQKAFVELTSSGYVKFTNWVCATGMPEAEF